MKIVVSADINSNKIYVNNLYNLTFIGKIVIKYFDNVLYTKELTLDRDHILWFSPYSKMSDISKIKVIILDENNNEFDSMIPLTYVNFMRADDFELNKLCDLIKREGNPVSNMIEIGSYQGESTIIFQKNFPNSKIFAVDFWLNNYDEREVNINSFNMMDVENNFDVLTKSYSNIIKIKMSSSDFSNIIADNSIDFIYIDGDHSYKGITNDLINWKNKIKKGGYIGGHDYNDIQIDTIIKAILENFPNYKINIFESNWLIKL